MKTCLFAVFVLWASLCAVEAFPQKAKVITAVTVEASLPGGGWAKVPLSVGEVVELQSEADGFYQAKGRGFDLKIPVANVEVVLDPALTQAPPAPATTPAPVVATASSSAVSAGPSEAVDEAVAPSVAKSAVAAGTLPGKVYDFDMGPNPTPMNKVAQFRAWVPDGVEPRAVMILLPGHAGDARGDVEKADWQAFAVRNKVALLGCRLIGKDENGGRYELDGAPTGASATILKGLAGTLVQAGIREKKLLEDIPVLTFGHSAGASLAAYLPNNAPARTIAAVSVKGAAGARDYTPTKGTVPILILTSQNDTKCGFDTARKNYAVGLEQKAPWAYAHNPTEGHELGGAKDIGMPFLEWAIKLRLGDGGSSKLSKVTEKDGLWADYSQPALPPTSKGSYAGNKSSEVWIPNDPAFIAAWSAYCQ